MKDWNEIVGGAENQEVGAFELGTRNERDDYLVDLCMQHDSQHIPKYSPQKKDTLGKSQGISEYISNRLYHSEKEVQKSDT
jgi:hypothetical protein